MDLDNTGSLLDFIATSSALIKCYLHIIRDRMIIEVSKLAQYK